MLMTYSSKIFNYLLCSIKVYLSCVYFWVAIKFEELVFFIVEYCFVSCDIEGAVIDRVDIWDTASPTTLNKKSIQSTHPEYQSLRAFQLKSEAEVPIPKLNFQKGRCLWTVANCFVFRGLQKFISSNISLYFQTCF